MNQDYFCSNGCVNMFWSQYLEVGIFDGYFVQKLPSFCMVNEKGVLQFLKPVRNEVWRVWSQDDVLELLVGELKFEALFPFDKWPRNAKGFQIRNLKEDMYHNLACLVPEFCLKILLRRYSSHLTNFRNNNALWFILIKHNLQDILLLLLENHLQKRDVIELDCEIRPWPQTRNEITSSFGTFQ